MFIFSLPGRSPCELLIHCLLFIVLLSCRQPSKVPPQNDNDNDNRNGDDGNGDDDGDTLHKTG